MQKKSDELDYTDSVFENEFVYDEIILKEMSKFSFDIKSKEEKTIKSRKKIMIIIICGSIFALLCLSIGIVIIIWKKMFFYLLFYIPVIILGLYLLRVGIVYFVKKIDLLYKSNIYSAYITDKMLFSKQKAKTKIVNRWLGNPWYGEKIRIIITDEQIYVYDKGIDSPFETVCEWKSINEYAIFKEFIFLYDKDIVQYSILPIDKIGFTKGDAESFITFLHKKGVRQKRDICIAVE